jgi:effector-binding domain-containing protein
MQEFIVTTLPTQKTLSITHNSTKEAFKDLFPIWMPKVFAYAKSLGLPPSPMFGRYHEFTDEKVVLEIDIIISQDVKAEGEITQNEIPGGEVVMTKHIGNYDTLIDSWTGLYGWLNKNEKMPMGPCYELYLTDPSTEPDPAKWVTEIYQPI